MIGQSLFLKPKEAWFLGMAIAAMLEDLRDTYNNPKINWTPEARKIQREMIQAGNDLYVKLNKLGIPVEPLPPYEQGDEKEFLTKES